MDFDTYLRFALALILVLFHRRASLDVSLWQDLREPGQPEVFEDATEPEPITVSAEQNDAAFAVGAGALVASHWLAQTGGGLSESERRAMLTVLAPAAASSSAKEIAALLT